STHMNACADVVPDRRRARTKHQPYWRRWARVTREGGRMFCPRCRASVTSGKSFCGDCGSPLPLECPACGSENPPSKKFCADCGGPLGTKSADGQESAAAWHRQRAAERRHITVMFVDLVGSTMLGNRLDPEDLREVIVAYQSCITSIMARFDGFIARYM